VPRPEVFFGALCVDRMNTGQALEHPGDEVRPHHRSHRWQRWLLPGGLAVVLAAWQVATMTDLVPSFLLPSPSAVASRFARGWADASLARHTLVTLSEVLAGLLLGVLAATVLGYSIAKSASLERLLSPYIVASQAIPIVAIAPLLVIWFGPTDLEGPDRPPDRLLPRPGEHRRRRSVGTAGPARADAVAAPLAGRPSPGSKSRPRCPCCSEA
jgi:hypothetical protein